MNRIIKSGLFFILALGMTLSSCKKEYDVPPISQLPVGKLLTIDEILTMPVEVPFDRLAETYGDSVASVCGIVTADEQSGNLYKMIFIQDRATGKAIELVLSTSSAARIGDSVRVFLDKDIIYYNFHNLPQLTGKQGKGFNPDGHLIIYPYNKPIEPKTVTISDILTGAHVGALVKLENAEFRLKNAAFCETGETTNRVVDDDSYTNTTDDPKYAEFVARTSNYANFAYDYMPVSKGSMVGIASVYNSTWQLIIRSKSEMIFDGYNPDPTPPTPTELEGDGSRENPYTANDVILMNQQSSDGHSYWVKGFIVGTISTGGTENTYMFSQNADINTNLIISSNIDASSAAETVPVQLPVGAVREGLNLVDHSENYKQEVLLYGTLDKYFSVAGVKNVSYAEINGTSFGTEPLNPEAVIFSESFANGQGDFNIVDVSLSGLTYVWTYMNNYHCMKANGYYQGAHDAESWLVSPQIDMTSVTTATLSFDHALAFADGQGVCSVQVSMNYNGDVTTATWTELSIATWPEQSNSFPFVTTTVSMNQFAGQTVTIAFRYNSTTSQCPAWEVKNVVVE